MSEREVAALRLERTFEATPEEVYDAWTSPAVLQRWWSAGPDLVSPGCDVDLRVGGRYVLRMHDRVSGRAHVVAGEYREVDRPRRLVYTWCWEGEQHVSLVTVEFLPAGESTTVVLAHEGLESDESRGAHGEGWTGTLASLAHHVFGEPLQRASARTTQAAHVTAPSPDNREV